jgi:hypothetical protein
MGVAREREDSSETGRITDQTMMIAGFRRWTLAFLMSNVPLESG